MTVHERDECHPAPRRELPVKLTPTNWADLAEVIERVWDPALMTGPVSEKPVAVLLGQWHLETAEGKAVPNFNLAGIKCAKPEQFFHQYFATKESANGGITLFEVKGRQLTNCFRAWHSLEDGVRGWLETIAGGYRATLPSLLAGNGYAWAREIGPTARPGKSWYTGPEENPQRGGYVQVVGDLTLRYIGKLRSRPPALRPRTLIPL